MRNLIVIAIVALVLTGCGSGKFLVTEKRHIVVQPPEGLWECPDSAEPPPKGTLQSEVADYVLRLYQSHKICQKALNDVRQYLEQAEKITKKVEE